MHCDYCFYCDEMEQRTQASYGFMSEETLQNVIRKTMLNADREISFSYQGGEPTLAGLAFFEKAVELQRKYNRKGIRVHNALQTNGYALNEKWCQFFVRHQFLIGLSIDGVQETHDVYPVSYTHLGLTAAGSIYMKMRASVLGLIHGERISHIRMCC